MELCQHSNKKTHLSRCAFHGGRRDSQNATTAGGGETPAASHGKWGSSRGDLFDSVTEGAATRVGMGADLAVEAPVLVHAALGNEVACVIRMNQEGAVPLALLVADGLDQLAVAVILEALDGVLLAVLHVNDLMEQAVVTVVVVPLTERRAAVDVAVRGVLAELRFERLTALGPLRHDDGVVRVVQPAGKPTIVVELVDVAGGRRAPTNVAGMTKAAATAVAIVVHLDAFGAGGFGIILLDAGNRTVHAAVVAFSASVGAAFQRAAGAERELVGDVVTVVVDAVAELAAFVLDAAAELDDDALGVARLATTVESGQRRRSTGVGVRREDVVVLGLLELGLVRPSPVVVGVLLPQEGQQE